MSKFFEFNQNNSGGSFDVDEKLCHRLFIEAHTETEATRIAEEMGVYFDGCEEGLDCPCCGDRWYGCSEVKLPVEWGSDKVFNTVEEYAQHLADEYGWTEPDCRIFYKDGKVVEIFRSSRK